MTEFVFSVIVAVLCIFGLTEILHILKQWILRPDNLPATKLIVYLENGFADLQLIDIIREYNWYGKFKPQNIVGVYDRLSDEELENCRKIAEKYGVALYSLEELEKGNDLIIV